ncbi:NAD(P)H-dependent flavin oxidoreductase [Chloroflexota bacterium]
MEWKTRVTELLGCKYPILQGAFGSFGNWEFAAAVAETGAYGILTASTSRTPEQLREDIKKCRAATDGAFGVNLSFSTCPQIGEMLEVCIEEGVKIETAHYKPDALAARIKEARLTWVHKAARVKDALHAEHLGADAVIVVGVEGAGGKNPDQLSTLITTTWGSKQFKVPFITAGGIGDARGFLGALGMGAEGITMGTAFMATKECPTNEASKVGMAESSPDNPRLVFRVMSSTNPKDYAEALKKRSEMPVLEWLRMLESIQPKNSDYPGPADVPQATAVGSLAVGAINSVVTCKELVDSIIREAEELLDGWQFLKTR